MSTSIIHQVMDRVQDMTQRLQIVWQLHMGFIIPLKAVKWLATMIRDYFRGKKQSEHRCMTELNHCDAGESSEQTIFNFMKHMPTSEPGYVPISWHTKRVFRIPNMMISIAMVVMIMSIHWKI